MHASVFACVWAHMYECICPSVCMCVEARGWCWNFLDHSSTLFIEADLSIKLRTHSQIFQALPYPFLARGRFPLPFD